MQYTVVLSLLAALAAAAPSVELAERGEKFLGPPIKATFTEYGSKDHFGSGSCNVNTVACGQAPVPNAFYAALSQNYYGAGPGQGAGPACGQCWQLTPQTDAGGAPLHGAQTIVVKINNLCPATSQNPLCSQQGQGGANQYGGHANFDTCMDDGSSAALFGSSGTGMAIGQAQPIDCSYWNGNGKRSLLV